MASFQSSLQGCRSSALAAICFLVAGTSEMFAVFQMTSLSCLALASAFAANRAMRSRILTLVGACLFGTLTSLLCQLSSPGILVRMANDSELIVPPVRSLPALLRGTIDLTFRYIGHREAFASFMMLFGVGLFAACFHYRPQPIAKSTTAYNLKAMPFWFAFIVQLIFVPILWTHVSDSPLVLGRFSPGFTSVVALNAAAHCGLPAAAMAATAVG